jgi:ABC-type phosphate/phosphonate transport system substrate-binding protein
MSHSHRTRLVVALWGALHAFTAAAAPPAETALTPAPVPAADSQPLTLKIGVNDIYCSKTACDCISEIATRSYDGVLAELHKQHITLEFTYFMEVMDLEKAIKAGDFDGIICKPWTGLRFNPRAGRDFKRVADILDPGNQATMTGLFVTPKASSIKTLADLKGKRVAFGQEDAYEKYHAPLLMLEGKGIKPGTSRHFSSCGENLDALMSGTVDAAVISSYALTASCAADFAKPENFKTIAVTAAIPLTSVLLDLNKVPVASAARVQQALLAISGEHAPQDLTGKGFIAPVSWQPVAVPAAASKP